MVARGAWKKMEPVHEIGRKLLILMLSNILVQNKKLVFSEEVI
jgi:hypothetical protein